MSTNRSSGAAVGFALFAAVMLIIAGAFQMLAGLAGIVKSDAMIYTGTGDDTYWLSLDTTGWGWTHLIIGIVLFLAGVGILGNQLWARIVGVIVASLSAVVNFAFIPIYPVWSIVAIALAVAVIWALTAHGSEVERL